MKRIWIAVVITAGCHDESTPPASQHEAVTHTATVSVAPPAEPLRHAIVSATSTGMWMGKPPLKSHSFDIVLRNPATEPRWLILPSEFPYAGLDNPKPGGAECELSAFEIGPNTLFVEGSCANFRAVHLAPSAELRLGHVNIESWWVSVPSATEFEVLVARDIVIGGASLASLIGGDVSPGGSVQAPVHGLDLHATRTWTAGPRITGPTAPGEGSKPLPVEFQIESRESITVPLVTTPSH